MLGRRPYSDRTEPLTTDYADSETSRVSGGVASSRESANDLNPYVFSDEQSSKNRLLSGLVMLFIVTKMRR
jgi:hypothetical protein